MLLFSYSRQRLLKARVAAAVLLVTLGARLTRADGASLLLVDVVLAGLLVIAFRIADDLIDRETDRATHPDRVTVRAESIDGLALFAAYLWSAAAVLATLAVGVDSLAVLLTFTLVIALWYRLRAARSAMNDRILLAKYAAFTIVLTGVGPLLTLRGALAVATVYLAACVYEWAHDSKSPISRRARSVEVALLAAACAALVRTIGGVR